jgi:hypothetical protein
MAALPTFEQTRREAHGQLGDVQDTLRSDWAPGAGPTDAQATALQEAGRYIALAKAALDKAGRAAR